jgi:hypothetical protein
MSNYVCIATLLGPILKSILERLINREHMQVLDFNGGIYPHLRLGFGL